MKLNKINKPTKFILSKSKKCSEKSNEVVHRMNYSRKQSIHSDNLMSTQTIEPNKSENIKNECDKAIIENMEIQKWWKYDPNFYKLEWSIRILKNSIGHLHIKFIHVWSQKYFREK
jgi:hypothetical protein